MNEMIVKFGEMNSLAGILTLPQHAPPSETTAIVMLNAGLLHRVGPRRVYVKIARHFAAQQLTCLRFDLSGIGDSSISNNSQSVRDRSTSEIVSALNYLQEMYGIKRFILLGSCSGALNAIKTANLEPRVIGTVLINFRAYTTKRYLIRKIYNKKRTIIRTALQKIGPFLKDYKNTPTKPASVERFNEYDYYVSYSDIQGLIQKKINSLIICSQWDRSLDYMYKLLKQVYSISGPSSFIHVRTLPGANHNLDQLAHQEKLIHYIEEWLKHHKVITNNKAQLYKLNKAFYKPFSLISALININQ